MLLPDHEIIRRVQCGNIKIEPFSLKSGDGEISYGVSSFGVDLRLGYNFKYPDYSQHGSTQCITPTLDPKAKNIVWKDVEYKKPFYMHPHQSILAQTLEYVRIPRDCLGIILGKSTYARQFLISNTTPIEPEWEGFITLELSNLCHNTIRVYPGEGICQLLFFRGESSCMTSYADKKGIYQNQTGVTTSKVRGI